MTKPTPTPIELTNYMDIRSALTVRDFMDIRRVRNEVRHYMTHHRKPISVPAQLAYMRKVWKDPSLWLLVCRNAHEEAIGFGVIRIVGAEDNLSRETSWLTGAISPGYRGRGLGEKLFRFMINAAPGNVQLDVFADNMAAVRLYIKLGFELVSYADDHILVMKLKRG